ncbi:MAG: vWA domain-containing protein [Candidatus Latescibacterota bacterium]|nr:vWA domain-containing protein [Candidatus Latescibacterota bacterium]
MLIDTSPSMAVSEGKVSRLDRVRSFFDSDLWKDQVKEFDVLAWGFADLAYPVSLDTLQKLKAGGQSTNFGETLQYAIRNTTEPGYLKSVLVLTDGIHNSGLNPIEVTKEFRIPIFSLSVGETSIPADLNIIAAESKGPHYLGQETKIKVKVVGSGYAGQSSDLVVYEEGKELSRVSIVFTGELQEIEVSVRPSTSGAHLYRLAMMPLEGEVTRVNNQIMTWLYVEQERLKVVLVASRPNSDTAFLFRALTGDSTLSITAAIQKTPGELYEGKWEDSLFQSNDVFVLLGYDPRMWSNRMSSVFENEIGNGKGLLWIGGPEGFDKAFQFLPNGFFPFEILDKSFSKKDVSLRLAKDGFQHPAFGVHTIGLNQFWEAMPPLHGFFPVALQKPNARVLIESTDGDPVFVSASYKMGKMIFALSQSCWLLELTSRGLMSSPGIVGLFWKNAIRWLGTNTASNRLEVTSERPIYRSGAAVTFSGRVMGGLSELERGCNVSVELDTGELIDLELQPNGFYRGRWAAPPSGEYWYRSTAKCGDNLIKGDKGKVVVDTYGVEWAELRTNLPLLEGLAEASGGSVYSISAAADLFKHWDFGHNVVSEINVFRLNRSSVILSIMVIFLATEWWLRRRLGMV